MTHRYLFSMLTASLVATAACAQPYAPVPNEGVEAQGGPAPYCREFTQKVMIGGVPRTTYGTSCRQPDGSWQVVPTDNGQGAAPPQAYQQPSAPVYAPGYAAAPAYAPVYAVAPAPVYYADPYYGPAYYGPGVGVGVDFDFGHSWYHDGYHGGGGGWRR